MTQIILQNMMFTCFHVKSFYCFLLLISLLLCSGRCERELKTDLRPDCDQFPKCSNQKQAVDLIYSTSFDNGTEKDHFISNTIGNYPGFLVTKSGDIFFDWDQLLSKKCYNSFNITSQPKNSLGVVFKTFFDLDSESLHWSLLNQSIKSSEKNFSAEYLGEHKENNAKSISVKLQISTTPVRYSLAPYLLYGPESMHLEIMLKNFTHHDIDNFNLTLLVYSTYSNHSDLTIKTISDEYAPGIFEQRLYKFYDNSSSKSFVEWKPLVYVSSERILKNSIYITSSSLLQCDFMNQSMLNVPIHCFFQELEKYDIYEIVVKLNRDASTDNKNETINIMSWSMVMGFGDEPQEELSSLLQWIIFIGIGLPAVILLISLIFFTLRKWKNSLNIPHSKLNEDILNY